MVLLSPIWVLVGLFPGLSQVLAGQVPIYNNVIGGAPDSAIQSQHTNPKVLVAGNSTTLQTTPGKLRVVENSGVCETTPGVYQASGYGDIAANQSLWFWFFAAREKPDSAPLTIWLNGGPGSSSMIGLFQENGPCRIKNDSSDVTLNLFSWNNVSNMLYLDQPVGTGFSHGDTLVGTSQQAVADVWTFLQMFFADSRFSNYQKHEFAIWTESYGGHYGPMLAAHILDQNAGIANGTVNGTTINLKFLGIGNGLTDPLSQYPGYLLYGASNPYHPLVDSSVIQNATDVWNSTGGCRDQITSCNNHGSDEVCSQAQTICNNGILSSVLGSWDPYYVLSLYPDLYPPALNSYLTKPSLMAKIGAESTWLMSSNKVYYNFFYAGDWMRTTRPMLEKVIDADVRTCIYDGDADYIVNYMGVEAMVDALQTKFTSQYAQQQFTNFTVNGQAAGLYKNSGSFSFLRVFGAGHEVPAYSFGTLGTGEVAFQMFTQIMSNKSLSSTAGNSTGVDSGAMGQPTSTSHSNSSPADVSSVWSVLTSIFVALLAILPF